MAHRSLTGAVLFGGLLGGALDLLFAVSFAGYNGAAPGRVFQTIASGLLGSAAFSGGGDVQALGIILHFLMALAWAVGFSALASRWPKLVSRPLVSAVVFGLAVFLVMRLVVLPLSAYPRPVAFKPLATVLDLLSHMLLFAWPITRAVASAVLARRPNNSSKPTPLRGAA